MGRRKTERKKWLYPEEWRQYKYQQTLRCPVCNGWLVMRRSGKRVRVRCLGCGLETEVMLPWVSSDWRYDAHAQLVEKVVELGRAT